MNVTLFHEDFSGFPLGPFPYDLAQSAMGEYHYAPNDGETGQWYDPIMGLGYTGPTWLITSPFLDKRRCMEQMRVIRLAPKKAVPTLRAGDTEWTDYTISARLRVLTAKEPLRNVFPSRSCLLYGMLYYSILLYYKELVNTYYFLLFFAYPNYSQKLMS